MASRGWGKNKKGYLVNSEGKTARQVKQEKYAAKKAEAKAKASGTSSLSVSGGGGEAPATGKSRLGRLIDSIEANQKADVQNYRRVLKVADKANAMAGGKPGGQPSGNATRSQLPGTAEKKGRFSKAVSDLEAIDKADLKNAAKTYGATAALMGAAKKSTEEKTAKGLNERKTKLLQKASEGKTPAKPASKGSDGVDVERFVERSGNKLISTDSRLTRFDFDMVSSRKTARDFDVEADAQKIATLKVGTNVPLVGMTKDGKIEVVSGDREFFAAKRASVLNPEADMVGAMVLKGSEIKGALAQKSLFKSHEGDFAVVTGKFSRVDTPDIVSSQKPPSKRVLDKQIEAILQTGEVGNVVPVVLRRVGKKSLVNQKYEIVSGHDSYHAMRELQRRNPNFEMTNAFILD